MMMNNCVQLIGHLVRDPEFRGTNGGERLATLNVVTKDTYRDSDSGDYKEKAEYHRVVVWQEGAVKALEKYCRKGSPISLRGKLQTRKWTDNDGVDRYQTEVVISFGGEIMISDLDKKRVRDAGCGDDQPAGAGRGHDDRDEIPF